MHCISVCNYEEINTKYRLYFKVPPERRVIHPPCFLNPSFTHQFSLPLIPLRVAGAGYEAYLRVVRWAITWIGPQLIMRIASC